MFNERLTSTPLYNDRANCVFTKIPNDNPVGLISKVDKTLVSTIRAFSAKRFNGDTFYIREKSYRSSSSYDEIISDNFIERGSETCSILVNSIDRIEEDVVNKVFDSVDKAAEKSSFKKVEKFTAYFAKQMKVACYIKEDIKIVVLLVENLDLRRFHLLQSGLPVMLPWYFDKKDGMTEDELELLKSFTEKTPDKYLACLEKMSKNFDIKSLFIKNSLNGYENTIYESRKEQAESQLRDANSKIDEYNNRIMELVKKKRDYETTLFGLEVRDKETSGTGLMDYFMSSKTIILDSVEGGTIYFGVKLPLCTYDKSMAESSIRNKNSYVYTVPASYNSTFDKEDIELLMRAIFIDEKLTLNFCAKYSFSISDGVYGLADTTYDYEYANHMPNPHINRYHCLGNYKSAATECIANGDYIMAIEQLVGSCGSLNFGDSPVMKEFMRYMFVKDSGVNNKAIVLPDGSVVNPHDAIEYLKKENKTNE